MRLPRLALASFALASFSLSLVSRSAHAEEAPPVPTEEPTPVTEPGANAAPPTAPVDVPPPSTPPSPFESAGTTSAGVVTRDDSSDAIQTDHAPHGKGHGVAYRNARLVYRDPSGLLELSPSGLLAFDLYAFGGAGVKDYQRSDGSGLKANLAGRRVRLELVGRIAHRWFFTASMESANGGAVAPLNNFIGVDVAPMLKLQVGQFRVPFGMDNSSSIRWGEFMERSLSARVLGAPLVRDLGLMAWGGTDRSALFWALAFVGGEGQNRASTDNRGDVIGRVLFRPLWSAHDAISQLHVGFSGRYGRRDRNYAQYDAPQMVTPGGYTFWSPTYGPTGAGRTHVQPSSDQMAVAAELFVPFRRFDLRGELVAVKDGRREVFERTRNNTERAGTLSGYDWYVQATWWPFGPPRMAGAPGTFAPSVDEHAHARAMSVAVRYEQLRLKYDSTDRSYRDDGSLVAGVRRGELDAATTSIKIDALQLAATYWATRHARITAEWSMYRFPGTPGSENQAVAPGTRPNGNAPDARTLHEISMRVQVTF